MKLQNGDVFVDGIIIVSSMNALSYSSCDLKEMGFVRFNSLAQMVHSIVLHERLVTVSAVPGRSHDHHLALPTANGIHKKPTPLSQNMNNNTSIL